VYLLDSKSGLKERKEITTEATDNMELAFMSLVVCSDVYKVVDKIFGFVLTIITIDRSWILTTNRIE